MAAMIGSVLTALLCGAAPLCLGLKEAGDGRTRALLPIVIGAVLAVGGLLFLRKGPKRRRCHGSCRHLLPDCRTADLGDRSRLRRFHRGGSARFCPVTAEGRASRSRPRTATPPRPPVTGEGRRRRRAARVRPAAVCFAGAVRGGRRPFPTARDCSPPTGSQRPRPPTRPLCAASVGPGAVRPRAAPRRRSRPGRPPVPPAVRDAGARPPGPGAAARVPGSRSTAVPSYRCGSPLERSCRSTPAPRVASRTRTRRRLLIPVQASTT